MSFIANLVQMVVPEPCFTKIFTDFDFFDGKKEDLFKAFNVFPWHLSLQILLLTAVFSGTTTVCQSEF